MYKIIEEIDACTEFEMLKVKVPIIIIILADMVFCYAGWTLVVIFEMGNSRHNSGRDNIHSKQ